jgi:hypothetical protein
VVLEAEGTRFLGERESIIYSYRAGGSGFKGIDGVPLCRKRLLHEVIADLIIVRGRACFN